MKGIEALQQVYQVITDNSNTKQIHDSTIKELIDSLSSIFYRDSSYIHILHNDRFHAKIW